MIRDHVTDVVGGTPLVRTHRLLDQGAGELLLKLEESNPTGSVKDRAAFAIVAQAEQDGLLRKGDTLVEATSGNFGRSLAMLGAALGYHVILVVDPKTPDESLRYARAFGAKIDVVDERDEHGYYQPARRRRAAELTANISGAFNTDQYDNPANARTHRRDDSDRDHRAHAGLAPDAAGLHGRARRVSRWHHGRPAGARAHRPAGGICREHAVEDGEDA
jgi:cystathionine beta-synthase/cysteine synthase A